MLLYIEKYILRIIQNPFICNSENAKALIDHIRVTVLIVMPGFISIMDRTIAFDYQICFTTKEISDVSAQLMLSSKFEAEQPAISKQFPKQVFS